MAVPPRETAKQRLAAAKGRASTAARRSDERQAKDSEAVLNRLLRLDPSARFQALADGTADLLPTDRRRLVMSLKSGAPARHAITGGTASRWALFRSRLPYRTRSLAVFGVGVFGVLIALLVTRANTPSGTVKGVSPQNVLATFKLRNGVVTAEQLVANQSYGLVRQGNGEAVLRQWVPGIGYAEAHVPETWIEPAP